jgi:hypothetical protein
MGNLFRSTTPDRNQGDVAASITILCTAGANVTP